MIDSSQVIVRKMVAEDVAHLAHAFAHMHKTLAQYARYWQENGAGQRVTLVAEYEGHIVGYTNIIWSSEYESFRRQDIPEINDMNVVASLRSNGIGSQLVEAAEELVRQSGKPIIGIGVGVTPDYAIAQRLYPKLGYVADGTGIHADEWGGAIYSTKQLGRG